jgi:undecaprenyl diphosphate synthase
MLKHLAFIMDGNRRWAQRLSNLVSYGHEKGWDNIENILELCLAEKLEIVSLWALSKENILERSEIEISGIFQLFRDKIPKLVTKLRKNSIRLDIVGDLWLVPPDIRTLLLDAIEQTKDGSAMTCIFAIGYSGQDEIIRGIKRVIAEWIDPKTLDEKTFLTYLDTGKYPPPDLIVRTGWAIRPSGFFLYQSAYSEYFFTETLWPDFGQEDFSRALEFYSSTKRNFWK